jgi:hypothetical protein
VSETGTERHGLENRETRRETDTERHKDSETQRDTERVVRP